MSDPTPGRWTWWTSNSWKRLMSEQDHGRTTVAVLQPVVNPRDKHPDLIVSEADMGIIAAAREMHDILDDLEDTIDRYTWKERSLEELPIPGDREYSINITEKQLLAISAALIRAREKP